MSTEKSSLDYGAMPIGELFMRLYFPTLLSLLAAGVFNMIDGIFVGQGVGSDALAGINVAAPIYLIATGVGLMVGSGISVVAAVSLANGNEGHARLQVTQALSVGVLLLLAIVALALGLPERLCYLFGGSERLEPYVVDYLVSVSAALFGCGFIIIGTFVIRLDGSPNYAMVVNVVPALLNIGLDYLFIFEFKMGIAGAGYATSISEVVGVVLVVLYFAFYAKKLRLVNPFRSGFLPKALRSFPSVAGVGAPALLGELAIGLMLVVGNYVFMDYLAEDGVAAFSVACYMMPIVFMFGNSVSQSLLPIVSYNFGLGDFARVRRTMLISVLTATFTGVLCMCGFWVFSSDITALFTEVGSEPHRLATEGMPLFACGFLFFTLNITLTAYYQSLGKALPSTVFMLLRGYILIIPFSVAVPALLGVPGLWLAVPASELVTFTVIVVYALSQSRVK